MEEAIDYIDDVLLVDNKHSKNATLLEPLLKTDSLS